MKYFKVPKGIEGLIFDIDGTLVDTMATHYKACQMACNEYGFDFPLEYFLKKAGRPTITVFKEFVQDYNIKMDGKLLGIEKEVILETLIPEFKRMPIIADTALHYHKQLPMSLGTGGTAVIAKKTIESVHMENLFEVVVTADDVKNFKPDPETFLKCAQSMSVAAKHCLVFEDGQPGIDAAKKAGMQCVDIRTITPSTDYSHLI